MEIIKCNCGYYKQLNDELCPNCKADYSAGDEYEVLDDQETAYMRWVNLGEKGFNDYMKSMEQPVYMLCPDCKFKMLVTETNCPRCNLPVKYKGTSKDGFDFIYKLGMGISWYGIITALVPLVIFFFVIVYAIIKILL